MTTCEIMFGILWFIAIAEGFVLLWQDGKIEDYKGYIKRIEKGE